MSHQNCHRPPSEAKQKRDLAFHSAQQRIAGAVIFGGAAILISSSEIARTFKQRQPDSFMTTEANLDLSTKAVGVEPETSAIRLEPIPSDPQDRLL